MAGVGCKGKFDVRLCDQIDPKHVARWWEHGFGRRVVQTVCVLRTSLAFNVTILIDDALTSETLAKSSPPRTTPTIDLYTGAPAGPSSSAAQGSTPFTLGIRLLGAHADEVVRDVWFQENVSPLPLKFHLCVKITDARTPLPNHITHPQSSLITTPILIHPTFIHPLKPPSEPTHPTPPTHLTPHQSPILLTTGEDTHIRIWSNPQDQQPPSPSTNNEASTEQASGKKGKKEKSSEGRKERKEREKRERDGRFRPY